MTVFFENNEITIFRHRKHSGVNKFSYSATFTAYSADIQPASQERTEFVSGRIGATFVAYIDATVDIKEGDQVYTESGKKYAVRAVQTWEGAGLLDHKELTLTSQDA